jgi:hypothetical protein
MNKEFVPYEQSLALKELGFDEPCIGRYYYKESYPMLNPNSGETELVFEFGQYIKQTEITILAPLYQQAFRWFREKYELRSYIYSDFSWNISGGNWDLDGYVDSRYDWDSEPFKTYEEVELDCLIKLIGIVKENIKYESNTRIQS